MHYASGVGALGCGEIRIKERKMQTKSYTIFKMDIYRLSNVARFSPYALRASDCRFHDVHVAKALSFLPTACQ